MEALALAARASAGFPAAFEPTFIPVGQYGKNADDRPDMAPYADWVLTGQTKDLSRFAVDGGVLVNTPTRPAIAGIRRREVSDTMVRRVLILVHPHAQYARDVKNVADDTGRPPTLVGTLTGVLRASGSLGSRTYVEEIRQYNELALQWRDGRQAAMAQFTASGLSDFLGENDEQQPAWQLFRRMRLRRGAYVSARNVRERFSIPFAKLIEYAAQVLDEDDGPDGLSFLPRKPPSDEDFTREGWQWGLNLAVGVASQATEVLRQLINAQAEIPEAERTAIVTAAQTGWEVAGNGVVKLERLIDEEYRSESGKERHSQANEASTAPESDRIRECLRENLDDYAKQMLPGVGSSAKPEAGTDPTQGVSQPGSAFGTPRGAQAIDILREIVPKLHAVIAKLNALEKDPRPDQPADAVEVGHAAGRRARRNTAALLERDNPLRGVADDNQLLKRMLQIEVVSYLTAEHDNSDESVPTVPIEFVQLSAHIEQHFASGFSSDDKLAGMSLNRFGAFLKRSWRANDWIWGRLDAVKILMLIVLTPEMIRGYHRRGLSAEVVVDNIGRAAFHNRLNLYGELVAGPLRELLNAAVKDVERAVKRDDAPLTNLASLAAYGFQVAVAEQDVPWLAGTIRDDRDDGAIGAQTAEFLNQFEQQADSLNGYGLLTVFANSRIGQEELAEQLPSDLMIRTTATAAATAVTALSSEKSGLAFARPVTKAARGMVALPYWVLLGLTGRGQIARAAATVLLALGVSLAALSLVTDLPGLMGKLVPTIGVASLVTVLGYATMRTQSIVHGAALIGLFIPLIAYAVDSRMADKQPKMIGETTIALIWVVLLLVWVMVVANFAPHTRSPAGWAQRAGCTIWSFVIEHRLILSVVAAAGLISFFGADSLARWYRGSRLASLVSTLVRQLSDGPWNGDVWSLTTLLLIAALVAGCIIAWWKSDRLRPSRRFNSSERARLADPPGLATAWSPVYGFIYLAIGVFLVPLSGAGAPQWARSASVVSLVLGLFFSLVAVNLIPYLREKRLVRKLAAYIELNNESKSAKDIIKAFDSFGDFSSYLTNKDDPRQLSRHGERIWRRARRIVARRA